MTEYRMWEKTPALNGEEPVLKYYPAEAKKTDATVVIFPGGGYSHRAKHEGEGYALYLNSIGMNAFVCEYRVLPYRFPIPLLDARRAVRYVRTHADDFGINPSKVAVMGSSAGGHLAALVSTYTQPIDYENMDDVDEISPLPNATILCYPVCHYPDGVYVSSSGSFVNLMDGREEEYPRISPDLLVGDRTPPAFIWHTAEDMVSHSYLYALALYQHRIPHEMHIFPHGGHGLGLAPGNPHVAQWSTMLKKWFGVLGWLPDEPNAIDSSIAQNLP